MLPLLSFLRGDDVVVAVQLFDKGLSEDSEADREVFRVGVSVSKYFVTKRLPALSFECLEVFGGNGFVEDFPMARLFRHSPLNSIWEGSGNVMGREMVRLGWIRVGWSLWVMVEINCI